MSEMNVDDAYQYGLATGEMMERKRIIEILKSIRVGDYYIGRDYAIDLISGDAE